MRGEAKRRERAGKEGEPGPRLFRSVKGRHGPRRGTVLTLTFVLAGASGVFGQGIRFAIDPQGADAPPAEDAPAEVALVTACRTDWPISAPAIAACLPEAPAPALVEISFPHPLARVTDVELDGLASLLQSHDNITLLSLGKVAATDNEGLWAYALKRIASLARGLVPGVRIGLGPLEGTGDPSSAAARLLADADATAYYDALLTEAAAPLETDRPLWLRLPPAGNAAGALDETIARLATPGVQLFVLPTSKPAALAVPLARLAAYFGSDVSRDPTETVAVSSAGALFHPPRFFRARDLTPRLFLARPGGSVRLNLPADRYSEARVENLASGVRRTFALPPSARALDLDASDGPLAVVLSARHAPGSEALSSVEVEGRHELTAEEIVARERAWEEVQSDRLRSYTAIMTASLRLRIGEFNETFDLTIRGPLFAERGKPFDWVWKEFYLNGVKWKGKTAPKIPILQPEKVRALPLAIALSEAYRYRLAGETVLDGHRVYVIDFEPSKILADRPAYRGRVWIDAATFARRRERVVQLNLRGDVLSNIETESFAPVPGAPEIWLPLTTAGEQVFSTAGRTTNVERHITLTEIAVNPPNLEARRETAYRSDSQIVRDTDLGLRYLLKDRKTGERRIEWQPKKSQLFGLVGAFYDRSLSYPLPLAGVNYLNFDVGGRGHQTDVFFAGVLLTANYTDPSFLGTRADAGADLFAVAVPFGDSSYRNGREVTNEKIKDRPLRVRLNGGAPLGPYVKLSLSGSLAYDHYARDTDTASDFILPTDTPTLGGSAQLVANIGGYGLSFEAESQHRTRWEAWGRPSTSEYDPSQQTYTRWRVRFTKDFFFSNFRRLHVDASYLDGRHLDRFSKYEFGSFSAVRLHGFQNGSVRTQRAETLSLSYGYDVGSAFRLEAFYDSAWATDRQSGYSHTYFSGAGLAGSMNGPWNDTILRFDLGVPIVGGGIHGVAVNVVLLKLFR
jgi:hypothetical protein